MIWKIHPYKIKEMLINKKLAKFDYKILTELDWKVRPVVISRMCQSSAPEAEIQKAFLHLSKVVFSRQNTNLYYHAMAQFEIYLVGVANKGRSIWKVLGF